MALTEEEKKKAIELYNKQKKLSQNSKKSGPTEPKMTKEEAAKSTKEQNKKVKQDAKKEKEIMAGRTDPNLYKTEAKPKTETEVTPKKTTNNATGKAQQFSYVANKPASFSAKAISSEAEKGYNKLPLSPIQRGKQVVGENIAKLAGVEQETIDNIRKKAIPKFNKDVFSESVDSGVANYVSNLTGSLGKAAELTSYLTPYGFITNKLNEAVYGETKNPFEAINEPLQKWQEKEALEVQQAIEKTGKGKSAENASRLITMATEMAPSIALSLVSGGAGATSTVGTIKEGFKGLTSAKKILPTLQKMTFSVAKDPVFWNSFGQILYPEYEEAVAKGASEGEATATALLSAYGQSALEKNFGIEKLPQAGAKTIREAIFDFVKSAVGESNEEVIQSVISGITQKLIFDHDQKFVSFSPEEDAVLNMANAFDEWVMTLAASSFMGIPGALVNAGNIKTANIDVPTEAPVTPVEQPVIETENVTPEVQNEQETPFANAINTQEEITESKPQKTRLENLFESISNKGFTPKYEDGDFFTDIPIVVQDYISYPGEGTIDVPEVEADVLAQAIIELHQKQQEGFVPENASKEQLAELAYRRASWLKKHQTDNVNVNNSTGDSGFGENTVGAAQSNPTSYAHLQNEHGVFEPGEQPLARDPNVPLKDAQGNRVSQSVRTIMEAKVAPDELIPAFEKEVAAGTFQNKGTTNKEAVEKAAVRIANKSFKDAVSDFETLYSDDKLLSKDDLVFGELLFSMAAQNGEADTAIKIASLLSSNNSRTGDAMQAQRILKRLSPEGRLYHAQRITEKFNKDKHQKNEIKLSEETVKKVLNAKTDEEIEAANDAVAEDIAKQIERGFFNDIAGIVNAWRYFSMLGNPKTHIRNFFGNVAFLPARKIKNVVKAGIESIAYKAGWINEKTATVKLASKENRDFAKKSFEKNKKALLSGGNYRFESEIDSKIEPFRFSGKETPVKKFFNAVLTPARKAAEFNSNALEAEDVLFLKNAYIDSFTQYLTANKIDVQNITSEQKTKAENYAAEEAAKATYRDYSAISSALEKLANTTIPIGKDKKALEIYGIKVKPFKFLVEANIPFRKTPINVLARGIEYSPVGLAKALAVDGYLLKKGDITANEMIDHISSGLTGSGVVVLGAALALKEVLTAGEKEDESEQAFDELQGKQNYALNIGDESYTIDWLSPTAIPLFIGAEAVQAAKEEYGDNPKWKQIAYSLLKNLDTIADPILELSMLDNLNKLLSGNYGKDGSAIAGLMKDSATSYVLQLIPTLSSQIAQTIDGTRRNAYYVDKTDNIPDDWQVLIQRAKAKIPGLSKELPAYVDAWGREQKQSKNIGVRIAENFFSPGYYKKRNITEVDEMLKQLYADTGESSILPKNFAKSFNVDGENLNLSGKQYVDAQKKKGQTAYNMLDQLIADKDFKKLSSEQKASIVSDVYSYANVKGKQEVSNYATDTKWYKNIEEAKSKYGIPNADYLIAKNAYSNIEGNDKTAKTKMLDQLVADKGTSAKQDVALMEYIAGVDMSKYKKATSEPSKQLALYKIKNDATKGKENDLEQIQKEFKEDVYGAREIYYKSEGDWNYNIDDVIDNGKNRDKKVSVYKKFGLSEEDIVKGYNATIGYNKKEDLMAALTDAFGSKKKATNFYNILKGKKGYK